MLRGATLLAAAVSTAAAADAGSLRVDGLPLPALGVTTSPYISAALPAPKLLPCVIYRLRKGTHTEKFDLPAPGTSSPT